MLYYFSNDPILSASSTMYLAPTVYTLYYHLELYNFPNITEIL